MKKETEKITYFIAEFVQNQYQQNQTVVTY